VLVSRIRETLHTDPPGVELGVFARSALEEPTFWTISTVDRHGAPQATVVWADHRDGFVVVNSVVGRAKARNLERDGRVALTWIDPADAFTFVSIKGRVVRSYAGEAAHADMHALIRKYTGSEEYPTRHRAEERITYLIEPTHVWQRVRPDEEGR
jgi:PPOX class probable F420-dependent enzyme